MTSLIPLVLGPSDLPEAELRAAGLDGELFSIGQGFGPVDSFPSPSMRAAALGAGLPSRLILERRAAAWVHGAFGAPPTPIELCSVSSSRYRVLGRPDVTLREVVLTDAETVVLGGIRVTSPLRTAIDLARSGAPRGDEPAIVRALADSAGFDADRLRSAISRRRHLPDKATALAVIAAAFGERVNVRDDPD